ncbi:hypothetical protein KXD40_005207 [Peronospora effusa]|nr:hypothetical protein KXD40_005207 [Peronospora effusa]
MHLRFGMIWAAVAAILVDLGTSAEQSRSARLLGSEVPAKRKLGSDNLINDNKEERAPEKFSFTNLLFDENLENVLSPVLHPQSDPAVSTVATFHPPPHQQFDAAVSTVPHQHYDTAVSTVDQLFAHYDDVKGQLNIVYEYAGATDARDRHARWLEKNMHPADVSKRLKLLPRKDLLVQIPTFRLIYYVDQYNKKNPLHPTKLLQAFGIAGFNEKALIKSVFLPNMDKKFIAQTSGMVEVQHIVSQENFDKALQRLQQYAKTQITKDLINFWLEKELGVKAVMARLGLSPQNLRTGYNFSRYKTLVMYVDAWNFRFRPKKFTILQVHTLMEQSGYTLKDFKILHEQSDQESALSLDLAKWIQTQETGSANANASGKKRKDREF